jgi:hypothetical protein
MWIVPHAGTEASMRAIATTLLFLGLAGPPRLTSAQEMNPCGCFHDETGACKCTNKKAKCICPGDCEPVGCVAKREKDAEREAAATLKKIQEREKKRAAEAARAAKSKTKSKDKKDDSKKDEVKEVPPP